MAMDVEMPNEVRLMTPNFNIMQNHFGEASKDELLLNPDESAYVPNYQDMSRPSYSPTMADAQHYRQPPSSDILPQSESGAPDIDI